MKVRVRFIKDTGRGFTFKAGEVLDLNAFSASRWIRGGFAERVAADVAPAQAPEKAEAPLKAPKAPKSQKKK